MFSRFTSSRRTVCITRKTKVDNKHSSVVSFSLLAFVPRLTCLCALVETVCHGPTKTKEKYSKLSSISQLYDQTSYTDCSAIMDFGFVYQRAYTECSLQISVSVWCVCAIVLLCLAIPLVRFEVFPSKQKGETEKAERRTTATTSTEKKDTLKFGVCVSFHFINY